MRVGIEATSLLGPRAGVGHSTAQLVEALVRVDDEVEVVLLPLSFRGSLKHAAPRHPRIHALTPRIPARLASWVWSRSTWPPVELFCGGVDVFHGPNNYTLPPLLKAAGVLTVHDIAFVRIPETCSPHVRTFAETVPVAAARAARIIVPSTFTACELAEWLPDAAPRIRVVPMAVRRVFAEEGRALSTHRMTELGIRPGVSYCLYVGTLEARKNVGLLLEAFTTLTHKFPDARLVLAGGPGPGWHDIAREHAGTLESDAVTLTGYLPDPEIAALMRGARVFVYPSRYEGFGIPPLEALACGAQVVATKAGALPETLGPHATLVPPGDAGELAAALVEAFESVAKPAGKAWAASFTWERTARATMRVYREAIGELAA